MSNHSITQKIINGLHRAALELEKLQVQVALGKAEAKDIYNEQKKIFADYIHTVNEDIHKYSSTVKEESDHIKHLLGEITHELYDLRAETKEAFEEQKKKIIQLIDRLENYIRSNKTLNLIYSDLLHEIEIFRLKLEIIRYRFDLKKLVAKEEFEKNKKAFLEKLERLKAKMKTSEAGQEKWDNFQTEMTEAYHHMKKAFTG